MVLAVISYLFGVFSIKWSPLWKQASSSLETLTRLYPAEVWSCFQTRLLHISGYVDEDGVLYTREEIESAKPNPSAEAMETEEKEKELQSEVTEVREEHLQLRERPFIRIQLSVKYGSMRVPRSRIYSSSDEILFE